MLCTWFNTNKPLGAAKLFTLKLEKVALARNGSLLIISYEFIQKILYNDNDKYDNVQNSEYVKSVFFQSGEDCTQTKPYKIQTKSHNTGRKPDEKN